MKITGEQVFSVPANAVTISASESGYTLAYGGGDGTFTEWEESTPAGETLIVNGFARGTIFKLVGNTDDVFITY